MKHLKVVHLIEGGGRYGTLGPTFSTNACVTICVGEVFLFQMICHATGEFFVFWKKKRGESGIILTDHNRTTRLRQNASS